MKIGTIRLSDWGAREISGLHRAFEKVFQEAGVAVYLFASRTDPDKKGGDIDLLTECRNKPVPSATRLARAMCLAIYQNIFGEQSLI